MRGRLHASKNWFWKVCHEQKGSLVLYYGLFESHRKYRITLWIGLEALNLGSIVHSAVPVTFDA